MARSLGCFTLVVASCCGCCSLRIPTFGFYPELSAADADAVRQAILASPVQVQHLCRPDEVCEVVEAAELELVPVGWAPLGDQAVVLAQVSARCRPSTQPLQSVKPVVCAGLVVAGVGATGPAWVNADWTLGDDPSWVPSGDGGDFDWD